MPKADVDLRDKAKVDYDNGMQLSEIAQKYRIPQSTVRNWKSRHWTGKKKSQSVASVADVAEKIVRKKAVAEKEIKKGEKQMTALLAKTFNNGAKLFQKEKVATEVSPKSSQLVMGTFADYYWSALTQEEKAMLDIMPEDTEQNLVDQIKLCTLREFRLTQTAQHYRLAKEGLTIDNVTTSRWRPFIPKNATEEEEKRIKEKKDPEKLYMENIMTSTIATYDVWLRLEGEITRVQRQKTECIKALEVIRMNKQRNGIGAGDDKEIYFVDDIPKNITKDGNDNDTSNE